MKIAFIVDPLDEFKIYKDSTFAMMREAAARGHELHAMQQEDVVWHSGVVIGHDLGPGQVGTGLPTRGVAAVTKAAVAAEEIPAGLELDGLGLAE